MTEVFSLPQDGLALEDARNAIAAMRGRSFTNRLTGISARLSSSAKGKLVSNKATGKTTANGFSRRQHNAIEANVGMLFEIARLAESRPDRMGDANILSIKRFYSLVSFGQKNAIAWITVKESIQHGHHIYSVEGIKAEAFDRKVEVVSGNAPHASNASTPNMLAYVRASVKRVDGVLQKFFTSTSKGRST